MNKKRWLTLLLGMCCFLAGALHIQIDPQQIKHLKSSAQLDSLITQTTYDFRLSSDQVSVRTIEIDSLFSRKVYTLQVPPGFSKTTFHHHLLYRLHPLNASIYGTVKFPDHDLNLQIGYNNTVHRTILIRTDPDLINQSNIIPRLPE